MHYFNWGWPILAFSARVGRDAARTIVRVQFAKPATRPPDRRGSASRPRLSKSQSVPRRFLNSSGLYCLGEQVHMILYVYYCTYKMLQLEHNSSMFQWSILYIQLQTASMFQPEHTATMFQPERLSAFQEAIRPHPSGQSQLPG